MALFPFRKEIPLSMADVQDEVNRLVDRVWHLGLRAGPLDGQEWAPAIDVIEEPDRFLVRAELPGLGTEEVDVSISGGTLTIQGRKRSDLPEGDDRHYLRSERRFGAYSRTVPLPATVDAENATAHCRKGVLEVVLPKKEDARPKSIEISVEE